LDLPSAPALVEILQNGRIVPALVEGTRSAYLYILDRVSGKPVFLVEEHNVPKGDVPGEWYAPTQPIPVKPLPLARIDMSRDDLVSGNETTPAHAKACEELWDRMGGYYNDGPFSPFLFRAKGSPLKYSIQFPGATGGVDLGRSGRGSQVRLCLRSNSRRAPDRLGGKERRGGTLRKCEAAVRPAGAR